MFPESYDIIKILVSLLLCSLIGIEREKNDKPAGLRTIILVGLGATFITIFSSKFETLNHSFDSIRAISYYLASIGFIGSGIIRIGTSNAEGITTASILLPISVIGFFCGINDYFLACIGTLIVYFVLNLKYIEKRVKNVR